MQRIKKKILLGIEIVLSVVLIFSVMTNYERRIFLMVNKNLTEYENCVSQLLEGEITEEEVEKACSVQDVKIRMGEHVVVDFFVAGFGLVPSSTYYGFYYSPEDLPLMHMDTTAKLTEYAEGAWKWQGVGDNNGVIKKITDCWYYYEASF